MQKIIRIGTRESKLALWQANKVRAELSELGYESVLVPIKSTGDIVLDKPLYELGVTGIFTKNLDIAMLNGAIDIAVHSLKDVPTSLPEGIVVKIAKVPDESASTTSNSLPSTRSLTSLFLSLIHI